MEARLKELREDRTRQKCQLTVAVKSVLTAIARKKSIDYVQSRIETLDEKFCEFSICNELYCNLLSVDENDEYTSFRTVSNLNLTEYFDEAKRTYNSAIESFIEYEQSLVQLKARSLECEARTLLSQKDFYFEKLTGSAPRMIVSEIYDFIDRLQNAASQLRGIDVVEASGFSLCSEVDACIIALRQQVINAKESMERMKQDEPSKWGLDKFCSPREAPHSVNTLPSAPIPVNETQSEQEFNEVETGAGQVLEGGARFSSDLPKKLLSTGHRTANPRTEHQSTLNLQPLNVGSITHAYSQEERDASTAISTTNNQTSLTPRVESRFKKPSLPTFSGNRKEWPEFQAVWKAYAYSELSTDQDRTYSLKQCLRGIAKEQTRAITANQPNSYERLWQRLTDIYSDASIVVRTVFEDLNSVKPVKEGCIQDLLDFINDVELAYCQLGEVNQLKTVSLAQVDRLRDVLPPIIKRDWIRLYRSLPLENQMNPFPDFMRFLELERDLCIREGIRDMEVKGSKVLDRRISSKTNHGQSNKKSSECSRCLLHKHPKVKHSTMRCYSSKKLTIEERIRLLIQHKACFKCAGSHRKQYCEEEVTCSICHRTTHHTLLCREATGVSSTEDKNKEQEDTGMTEVSTNFGNRETMSTLFAIHEVPVAGTRHKAVVFYDNGSNTSYITHRAAKRLKATKLGRHTLVMKGIGNKTSEYATNAYRIRLVSMGGETISIIAYGLNEITSPVSPIGMETIHKLFPDRKDAFELSRSCGNVDLLLGAEYYGYHPKVEIDYAGKHLFVVEGPFGKCLIGSHPLIKENTSVVTNLSRASIDDFIHSEEMVTEIIPRCGSCKCGKCPIPGHTYSFREEQELNMIRSNLKYDRERKIWCTKYPWSSDPYQLPNNYQQCLATLRSTEKSLKKRGERWGEIYTQQIEDMIERGVARKLTQNELDAWTGPAYYISHLAVENHKSNSTPVRIVFNSSQKCRGVSLNDCLIKGPDNYINSLIGILLRWRENPVTLVGDIKKMFHSIATDETTQHCHRFLWRGLQTEKLPDTYVITRVNMGDRPAPAICAEAIKRTAELASNDHPDVAKLLDRSIYVDDIVDSVSTINEAKQLALKTEEILSKFGFKIKCWQFSGEKTSKSSDCNALKGNEQCIMVLGLRWTPETDTLSFDPTINFSRKVRGTHTQQGLSSDEIPASLPISMTRRQVLEQVMKIYDPLGLISPFVLQGKLLLTETWNLERLEWDEPLPNYMVRKWSNFFCQMTQLAGIEYDRQLTPNGAVGQPSLIIFSDASDKAYGFAAYIRWKLSDDTFWSRLIMAKSRVAPMKKLTTPQLELNGAVLAKRARQMLQKEMRIKFSNVVHLVDSETVLHMLHKDSTRFKLYEGVRLGEIQSSCNGNMTEWQWVSGESNIADWVSRGRCPNDLGPGTEWIQGPFFLQEDKSKWPVKSHSQLGKQSLLPGEKKVVLTNTVVCGDTEAPIVFERYGKISTLLWVVARLKAIARLKSFKGGSTKNVTTQDFARAEQFLIAEAQKVMLNDIKRGKYRSLKPILDDKGLYHIGSRMVHNPMCEDQTFLLPTTHTLTGLLMRDSHVKSGHRGRDTTLARFRSKYWTPHGPKLAKAIVNNCQACKLRKPVLAKQVMGKIPSERLSPSAPFAHVMLDLFGPFLVRGEVQKRTSGKVYGIIFTDVASRAVHVEPCYGYDTSSFLQALRRFTSIRGWPETIYSDLGSQLVNAEKHLRETWEELVEESLYKISTDKGTRWIFGPGDSPWYQGAAESLIKSIKQCFKFAMGSTRLSVSEFHTLCYESANILNERPLGTIPGTDSDVSILTPNCLLLGRSTANLLDSCRPALTALSASSRYGLVNLVAQKFWEKWIQLYIPTMVRSYKWNKSERDFKVNDIVVFSDSNKLRSQYTIAEVTEANPDTDGKVRRVRLRYKSFNVREKKYKVVSDVTISRSIQRIALLVPADDTRRLLYSYMTVFDFRITF